MSGLISHSQKYHITSVQTEIGMRLYTVRLTLFIHSRDWPHWSPYLKFFTSINTTAIDRKKGVISNILLWTVSSFNFAHSLWSYTLCIKLHTIRNIGHKDTILDTLRPSALDPNSVLATRYSRLPLFPLKSCRGWSYPRNPFLRVFRYSFKPRIALVLKEWQISGLYETKTCFDFFKCCLYWAWIDFRSIQWANSTI